MRQISVRMPVGGAPASVRRRTRSIPSKATCGGPKPRSPEWILMPQSYGKLLIVRALQVACTLVDDLAYRPLVVRLTGWMPRWWSCQLSHLSMKLDDRWHTGFWRSPDAPPIPEGLCDACGRRAAWLVVGGFSEDPSDEPDDYLAQHPIYLCGWCRPDFPAPPRSRSDVELALAEARARSIAWRWRSD
jgi:hypothetical protein